jgi:hypothetical protein
MASGRPYSKTAEPCHGRKWSAREAVGHRPSCLHKIDRKSRLIVRTVVCLTGHMTSGALIAAELRRRLAANARRLRLDALLTIKQAAGRVGMHWRHWQKIEAGQNNATLATIVRVASALNVTPAELLAAPPPGAR